MTKSLATTINVLVSILLIWLNVTFLTPHLNGWQRWLSYLVVACIITLLSRKIDHSVQDNEEEL
ncbi:MAG: hypothetical protein KHZ78_05585 [Peptoniphilus sp. oral taxon 375]|nr:hypothetical protein HMPREF9130_1293 [Peptoniphilus sp. oral taxon 375 str. F0436]MBS4872290.1 hypothetical protein [Peptoniphilus sp. oral taxon 375]